MAFEAAAPPAFFSRLSDLKFTAGAEYFHVPVSDDNSSLSVDSRLPNAPVMFSSAELPPSLSLEPIPLSASFMSNDHAGIAVMTAIAKLSMSFFIC